MVLHRQLSLILMFAAVWMAAGPISVAAARGGCGCGSHHAYSQPCQSGCLPYEATPSDELAPIDEPDVDFQLDEQSSAFAGDTFVASASNGGYIDNAIPVTQFRFRFDAAYNNPFPDRAEFFYPQCGCFTQGNGPGPPLEETGVDYQEFRPYFEVAWNDRLSFFLDAPIRAINPDVNTNEFGFSDLIPGFKYAVIARPNSSYVTFQLKVYTPTGDGERGLGTAHVSIEPGVLAFQRLGQRTTFEAEIRPWIPISDSQAGGRDFAGTVLRYGAGVAHDVVQRYNCGQWTRLTAVVEGVGWSVLGGQAFSPQTGLIDADGDTIINIKVGGRYSVGRNSLYVGYGRGLTGDIWYREILRAEYRLLF